jgi:hypothetical protein
MRIKLAIGIIILVAVLTGCATSRNVTVGQLAPQKKITTAALVPQDGNSPEMDSCVKQQLMAYGITSKLPLPAGTRQSNDVDIIVAYSDVWYWDIIMYLRSLTINLFDGPSGYLLATGRWDNSFFHGYQSPRDVVKELLDDMLSKLSASK